MHPLPLIPQADRPSHPFARAGLWQRCLPFAAILAAAYGLVLFDSQFDDPFAQYNDSSLLYASGAVALLTVALVIWVPWTRLPRPWHAVVLALVLVYIGILRHYEAGVASGYDNLTLLPVLWLALYGYRSEVLAAVLGALLTLLTPMLVFGEPLYPAQAARATVLTVLTGGFIGLVVQALISRVRSYTRALTEEAEELRAVQEALIPSRPPQTAGLDVAARFQPRDQGVAGDFYLVCPAAGGRTLCVLGDVMGKGLDAARRANFVRASLASFASFCDDPVRPLELANRALLEHDDGDPVLVTCACVLVDADRTSAQVAIAGHPAPLDLRTGRPLTGMRSGLPLGVDDQLGARAVTVPLRPGDGVLLYSDGLTEARSAAGELFGEQRASDLVAAHAQDGITTLLDRLAAAAQAHAAQLQDDLCLLAVRRTA